MELKMERSIVVIFLFLQCFSWVHSTNPTVTFSLTCFEDRMTGHFSVVANEGSPFTRARVLNIELLDTTCTEGTTDGDGNERNSTGDMSNGFYELNMTTKYDECGTLVYNLTDKIVLNNTAQLKITELLRDQKTKRVYYYKYDMSCELDRNHNVTSNFNYTVDYGTVNITEEFETVENFDFDFSLDFYPDNSYGVAHTGQISVNTNEMLFIRLKEGVTNTNFRFVVTECAADTSATYSASTADIFFQNRCSLDPTFEILSTVDSADNFDFKIQAFSFVSETDDVYFHCKLYICKQGSTAEACQQNCATSGGRQRREAEEGVLDERIVTSAKIVLKRDVDCDDITCAINSKCVPLQPARCICDDGYVFSRLESKCVKDRIVEIENIHLDLEWNEIYADPTSPEFLKLALKYEEIMYKSFIAADATSTIEGVRVIGASSGSIILETRIIYAAESTAQEGYNAFIKSITSKALDATTVRRDLKLLNDRTPAIVEIQKDMADIQKLTLIIIVVVLLLVVLMSAIVIFAVRRNRKRTTKLDVNGVDNGGLDMKYPS